MSLLDSVTEEAVDDLAKAGVEASLRDRSGADGSIRILLFKQIPFTVTAPIPTLIKSKNFTPQRRPHLRHTASDSLRLEL